MPEYQSETEYLKSYDGILGRLFGTRLGFGFLKIKSDETSISKFQSYIDEIQNIEMEIRNISHELKTTNRLQIWILLVL